MSDILYIKALAAPFTVNTMPEGTLKAFADTERSARAWRQTAATSEYKLAEFSKAGIDIDALAAQLQDEGAESFVKSWNELLGVIVSKARLSRKPAHP